MSWPFPIPRNAAGWPMQLFVIYENPRDAKPGYPYVIRRWEAGPGLPSTGLPREAMCATSLEAARTLIPPGMVQTMPPEGEDPCIKETWL